MKRKILSMALTLCMLMAFVPCARAENTIGNGICGDSLVWNLNSDGVLTISGEGDMWDYVYNLHAPWYSNADSIKNVVIEQGVTSVGDMAFWMCEEITQVSIPDSVTKIGNNAFNNCSKLSNIEIPDSVLSIGTGAFLFTPIYNEESNWVDNVLYIDNYLIAAKTELSGLYEIKSGTRVIGDYAFNDCQNLQIVSIPASVVTIGNGAFSGAQSLVKVEISSGVKSIGDEAFYECRSLETINIPNSVTSIGGYAFAYCRNLNTLNIPDEVIFIGKDAFTYVPVSSETDENGAIYLNKHLIGFNSSYNLGDYTVKAGTKSIACQAFQYARSLKSITIPDSVAGIGTQAFDAENLQEINVDPNNQYFTSVDGVLFNKDKTELIEYPASKTVTTYSIPSSVKKIGDFAFLECTNLTYMTIPSTVKELGVGAFSNCYNMTNVIIPKSIITIPASAFYNVPLNNVSIPSSVKKIERGVFGYCETVTIPKTVEIIYPSAFSEGVGNIYCYKGSTAHNYALSDYKKFTFIDNPSYEIGDVTAKEQEIEVNIKPIANTGATILALSFTNNKWEKIGAADVDTTTWEGDVNDNTIMFGESGNISVPIDTTDSENVKIFIWDSLTGMRPLCEPVTVNISGE